MGLSLTRLPRVSPTMDSCYWAHPPGCPVESGEDFCSYQPQPSTALSRTACSWNRRKSACAFAQMGMVGMGGSGVNVGGLAACPAL